MTDPIVSDLEKSVMLPGGCIAGSILTSTVLPSARFLGSISTNRSSGHVRETECNHTCAACPEQDIQLCGDRLETEFRGCALDITQVIYNK